ncbi:MAG: sigma-B regulation protein RsbU (phosphoserine phosphatase) [Enterobacterales bacterium]
MDLSTHQDVELSKIYQILVIDDDVSILETMNVYLSNSGYEVHTASNGTEALNSFNMLSPELIICDLRLPDIDGLELIAMFNDASPEVPIIAFSGMGTIKDVTEAIRRGASDYLIKPIIDFNQFDNAIKSALIEQYQKTKDNDLHQVTLDSYSFESTELIKNLKFLNDEPSAARQIQLQFLPEPDTLINNYNFQHTIIPSPSFSNIFLDYFQLDKNYICFYIAEISIHNDNIVFVNMLVRSLINQTVRNYKKNRAKDIINPAVLLKYLNQELMKSNVGKFISMFYGVISINDKSLCYSVGGYNPLPILINGTQQINLLEDGFPIGLFEWAEYEQHDLKLNNNFRLGMFSSGLVDILTNGNRSLSAEYLAAICKDDDVSVAGIIQQLNLSTKSYYQDDMVAFLIQHK